MKGFTVVELLVVIFIISTLSSLSFVYYRSGEKEFALMRSASKLAQDIRRAQEMAMALKKCCGGIIPAGYGVYLKRGDDYYLLYADTNPSAGNEIYDGGDYQYEIVTLEKNVVIHSANPSSLSINFKPPDPNVTIKTASDFVDEITIILSLKDNPSKTKKVKVNKAGLISVE